MIKKETRQNQKYLLHSKQIQRSKIGIKIPAFQRKALNAVYIETSQAVPLRNRKNGNPHYQFDSFILTKNQTERWTNHGKAQIPTASVSSDASNSASGHMLYACVSKFAHTEEQP